MTPDSDRLDKLVKAVQEAVELKAKAKIATAERDNSLARVARMINNDDVLSAIHNGQREIGRMMTEDDPAGPR